MAALAAAFDLTRTQALRDEFDVTIYQMGWRLGGKAASGRDCDGRIVEHGLHVWFGCYENAFELVRAAYADWDNPHEDQAIKDVDAAFQAKRRTVMGSGDCSQFFQLDWPQFPGKPGDGSGTLSFWPCVHQMLEVVGSQYTELEKDLAKKPLDVPFPPYIRALLILVDLPIVFPASHAESSLKKSVCQESVHRRGVG